MYFQKTYTLRELSLVLVVLRLVVVVSISGDNEILELNGDSGARLMKCCFSADGVISLLSCNGIDSL